MSAASSLSSTEFVRRDPVFVAAEDAKAKELFVIPEHYRESIESVLIPHGFVVDRASKLAADIREDYGSSVPHLLCVLKGGHEFFTDLTAALRTQHQQSGSSALPYTFDFVRLQSYEGTSSTGSVTISGIKLEEIAGLDVLIVEDIVDTGLSMSRLIPHLMTFSPKSVRVATLLEKRTPESCGFKAHYVGFSVPNSFVIGYNMDYNEVFRDLPHVCIINSHGITKYSK